MIIDYDGVIVPNSNFKYSKVILLKLKTFFSPIFNLKNKSYRTPDSLKSFGGLFFIKKISIFVV